MIEPGWLTASASIVLKVGAFVVFMSVCVVVCVVLFRVSRTSLVGKAQSTGSVACG